MLIKYLRHRRLLKLCSALPPSEIEKKRKEEKEALEKELLAKQREAISERTYKEIVEKLLESLDLSIKKYSTMKEDLQSQKQENNPRVYNYIIGGLETYERIKREILSDLEEAQEKANNGNAKNT